MKRIEEVAFTGEGCAISIASASLLAEELPGMTLSKVRNLDREDALDLLGIELTPIYRLTPVLNTQNATGKTGAPRRIYNLWLRNER